MQKITHKNRLALLLITTLLIAGCADGKKRSYQEALLLFKQYEQEMEQLITFCNSNTAVYWIELNSIHFYDDGDTSEGFGKQLYAVRNTIENLKAVSVSCYPSDDLNDDSHSLVSVVLYSGGFGQSFYYKHDWTSDSSPAMSGLDLKGLNYIFLDKPGWFFRETH